MKTKTKRSDAIREELATLDQRIAEFRPQLDERTDAMKKANADFLKNDIGIEAAIAARSAQALIQESIDTLIESRERLKAELDAALEIEQYDEMIGAMQVLVIKRKTGSEKLTEMRQAFADLVSDYLTEKADFDKTRAEFIGHLRKLIPDVSADARWPIVSKRAAAQKVQTITAALEQAGISSADIGSVINTPDFPRIGCEQVIVAAENYQMWTESQRQTQDRLRRIDELNHKQTLAAEAEQKRLDMEARVRAEKQQGKKWRFAS